MKPYSLLLCSQKPSAAADDDDAINSLMCLMTAKCHVGLEAATTVVMKSPVSWDTTFSKHSIIYQKPGLFTQQPITMLTDINKEEEIHEE
jgi:hypothetical protein